MGLDDAGQQRLSRSRCLGVIAWPGAMRHGDQVGVRCVFMRGGTSRGVFLHEADLPDDPVRREKLILGIYGSPDVRQIDGLGGATPLTSKVAIVGRSARPDADVDFTFGQAGIGEPRVEFSGECGNMAAAVGPFAIDERLVAASEPLTGVRIHLTNTKTVLTAEVPVCHVLAAVDGETEVSGVPGLGAKTLLDFKDVGGTLGRGLLPTGHAREVLQTSVGAVEVSIVDAANPVVFVKPAAFGLTGVELPDAFTPGVLAQLEAVRAAAAKRLGLRGEAMRAIPKLYLISSPADYTDLNGRLVRADRVNVIGRGLSMGVPHEAYAATVAVGTAAAALLPGTLVQEALRLDQVRPAHIRIGHPGGILGIDAEVEWVSGHARLVRAAIERTARRIMEGTVYVPLSRLV
jgi:methylitaconate Delta-isomerase